MPDVISQYYRISEILNDDTHLVAYLIQKYHNKRVYFSTLLSDLEFASVDRLAKFSDTLDLLSSMSEEQIIKEAQGITFENEQSYIKYLQELLELNGLVYVKNSKVKLASKSNKPKTKFVQGELF